MARIRTIKPEFPQSESIGRVSRDARLLFLQLFTVVDDDGRTRAASRMLASLLYPYDDDVPGLIDGWLDELESEGHVRRYIVGGVSYLEILNWLKHQKIAHPSPSRLPPFNESSRTFTKPPEDSGTLMTDLGPRTLDLGSDDDDKARGLTISEEANRLSDELAKICGHEIEFLPPSWMGAPSRVQTWLTQGWPKEIIILSVREQVARKRDGPIDRVQYFEKGIAAAIARNLAPLPTVTVRDAEKVEVTRETTNSVVAAQRRLVERVQALDRPPEIRSGEGTTPVRMLSKR